MAKHIPLSVPTLAGNEWRYVKECLDTGWLSSAGKFVECFERKTAAYSGAKHAVACSNGTAGLHLALQLCGVGPGDEVIVPTLTFIAPVNAVRYLGAFPVFMDCRGDLNIDPDKLEEFCSMECRLTKKGLVNKVSGKLVKAIVPVHVFGNPCDMAAITATARKYGLKVVEDATESIGSSYSAGKYKGRHTGGIGDFGVYSFNGNKIITTGGGGMLLARDAGMAKRARYLSTQAKDDAFYYVHNEVGYNYRLTNLQAALGVAQLEQLDSFIRVKRENFRRYSELLAELDGVEFLSPPPGTDPNYWFYALKVPAARRDRVMKFMKHNGVEVRPVWKLNHTQKPYAACRAYRIEKAFEMQDTVINLPCSSSLKAADVVRVCALLRKVWNA